MIDFHAIKFDYFTLHCRASKTWFQGDASEIQNRSFFFAQGQHDSNINQNFASFLLLWPE